MFSLHGQRIARRDHWRAVPHRHHGLLRSAAAWQGGDQTAALLALDARGLTLPPLQILTSPPFIPTANVASPHVENQILSGPM
jgi:hypothetical protein